MTTDSKHLELNATEAELRITKFPDELMNCLARHSVSLTDAAIEDLVELLDEHGKEVCAALQFNIDVAQNLAHRLISSVGVVNAVIARHGHQKADVDFAEKSSVSALGFKVSDPVQKRAVEIVEDLFPKDASIKEISEAQAQAISLGKEVARA